MFCIDLHVKTLGQVDFRISSLGVYTRQKTCPFFFLFYAANLQRHTKKLWRHQKAKEAKGLPKDNKVSILFVRLTSFLQHC